MMYRYFRPTHKYRRRYPPVEHALKTPQGLYLSHPTEEHTLKTPAGGERSFTRPRSKDHEFQNNLLLQIFQGIGRGEGTYKTIQLMHLASSLTL